MKRILFSLFVLLFAGSTIEVAAASKKVPTPDQAPEGVKIATAQDVQKIIDEGGIVYDVRWHYSEYVFEGHIPTAVSVPFTEWSSKDLNYNINEDSWDWSVLPKDKNTPMVFYCMGVNCWKSYKVADEAAKRGYTNVWWYKEGQPGWDALGLPVESRNASFEPLVHLFSGGNNPLTWLVEPAVLGQMLDNNAKVKVIDLRYISFFEEGRIGNAFNVSVKDLMSRDGIQLMPKPADGITIVLVSENGQIAAAAATGLALLGYDVKVLNGGMKAWYNTMGQQHIVKGKLEVNTPNGSGWKGQNFKLPKN